MSVQEPALVETQATKLCRTCKRQLPASAFYSKKNRRDGLWSYCKQCHKIKNAAWIEKNEERYRLYRREANQRPAVKASYAAWVLKKKYGMTPEDRARMMESQGGVCPLCGFNLEDPCIDHCHASGKVRAILCRPCNGMLGSARDSVSTLQNAINYLLLHSGQTADPLTT